jgi:hypothetical protein
MKERGEITLTAIFCLILLTSLLALTILKLEHSFDLLQRRTHLFLCAKETSGEMKRYLTFMGRTNWGIKNAQRASLIMVFIPGLQGGAAQADKVKKILIHTQELSLIAYLKKLNDLKKKGCPLDPRILITPFELAGFGYKRDLNERAKLREKEWTYYLLKKPYLLELSFNTAGMERINPKIKMNAKEKGAKFSSLFFSPY